MILKEDGIHMSDKVWILGPCSMENEHLYLKCAEELTKFMDGRDWYYKASFDKANRTAVDGGRGPGIDESLRLMEKVREEFPGIRLTTDIHECHQAKLIADQGVELCQIPAFLCRQTDLLIESGKCFDKVNIKKGQWINPDSTKHFVGKVKAENPDCEVWITERGTFFGYNQLIVDFGAAEEMSKHYDRVILDCTHSTQRKKGDFTGGDRELAAKYMIASLAYEYSGIFAECHPEPRKAVSDGDCQLYLDKVENLIKTYDEVEKVLATQKWLSS
tara:strand:+ start:61927 stop:62748 length:822 start_codon:yes stop_codon:yes gene_type:complete